MGKHEGQDFYPEKRKKENLPKTEEHEGRVPPSGLLLNGLLPNGAASEMWLLDSEQWLKAEERTAGLISCIKPNAPSIEHRNAVADYVQRLITKCFPCQVFPFGSVPLRTYLPDEDINLTALSGNQTLKDSWAHQVCHMLENEEKNKNAEFRVEDVQYVEAEVKIIKCLVENIVVDISFNQLGGLTTLRFLKEVDRLINQNHLFKRSIILIKAWCYYESRILGAHHGLLSTYALETLVLYIFNVFNNSFAGPLEVLYRFLEFYSKFDWDCFCVSLWGPVRISSLPDVTAEPPQKDGGELPLSKLFLEACISAYAVSPGDQENRGQSFDSKYINVIDPLHVNNNLGCSVSEGNFFRIRRAFDLGAKQLARLLNCPKEYLFYEVNHFFKHTWDRHGSGHRADAPRNDLRLANPLLNKVSNREIRKGSNETTVRGENYGQPAPEEIPVEACHEEAVEEVQILQLFDSHPNIVRWHGKHDKKSVYLALDSCICSLDELILSCSETSQIPIFGEDHATRLELLKSSLPDIRLWKENTHPSPLLIKLMRDIVSELVNLHGLKIIHGDLKPQSVVIIKQRPLCAKLSGIGNSKRLLGDMFSLDHHVTGSGSSGWQAPEQHRHEPQTPAVDMFSLGCILFFCMTGGKHPFGDHRECDYENILKDQRYIFLVDHIPEAVDLIPQLLNANPDLRLVSLEVLNHPLFWSSETRLSFLDDTSDEMDEADSDILKALERIAPRVFGNRWDIKMESAFIRDICCYRHYNFQSVRDLLRALRNKLNHYGKISKIQELIGPYPEGFDEYFTRRFPKLLMEVYKFVWEFCREEQRFQKYFKTDF